MNCSLGVVVLFLVVSKDGLTLALDRPVWHRHSGCLMSHIFAIVSLESGSGPDGLLGGAAGGISITVAGPGWKRVLDVCVYPAIVAASVPS